MSCEDFVQFIIDYLDGCLSSDVARTFEDHLAQCAHCETFLHSYRTTVDLAEKLREEDCGDVPEHLISEVLKAITSRGKKL
jgi:anti-sigma factor RsiW